MSRILFRSVGSEGGIEAAVSYRAPPKKMQTGQKERVPTNQTGGRLGLRGVCIVEASATREDGRARCGGIEVAVVCRAIFAFVFVLVYVCFFFFSNFVSFSSLFSIG